MIGRRSFLGGIFAAGIAPAFIKAGVLMPVRPIWVPTEASLIVPSNRLLTISMITQEALKIMENSLIWHDGNHVWGRVNSTLMVRM